MDYNSMPLAELKQEAKNHVPKIKQYYIKSRAELIAILSMEEFTDTMKAEKMRIDELRKEASSRGHKNVWKMRRAELMTLLYPSPHKNRQDDNHAQKHDNPEAGERKEVGV